MMKKCLPTPSFSISENVNCLGEWSDASLWLGTLQHCDGSLKASFPAMAEKKISELLSCNFNNFLPKKKYAKRPLTSERRMYETYQSARKRQERKLLRQA